MKEINRMNGINSIQSISSVQPAKLEEAATLKEVNEKVVDNLNGPADIVGRSQIGKVDNVKEDVNFMLRNPEIMAKTEAFFDMAYAKLLKEDSPNAYEKASAMATTFARELSLK